MFCSYSALLLTVNPVKVELYLDRGLPLVAVTNFSHAVAHESILMFNILKPVDSSFFLTPLRKQKNEPAISQIVILVILEYIVKFAIISTKELHPFHTTLKP